MKLPDLSSLKAIKLHPRLQKVLKWSAYGVGYVAALIFFAYVSFPYDRLKHHLITSYHASQTGPDKDRLEIDDLTWSWRFPGIVAEGVRLELADNKARRAAASTITASDEAEAAAPAAPPEVLSADEVFVRVSPLALLTGERAVSFSAEALGGSLHGTARESEAAQALTLDFENLDPSGIPQLVKVIGLPVRGQLSGRVQLELAEGKLARADGTLELEGRDLQVGDGQAKIRDMIALPPIEIGELKVKAEITAGRLKINEFAATGRDVELALSGGVRLRPKLDSSLAELELSFSFSDKYKGQNEMTRGLFGSADSSVPGLFDTVTKSLFAKSDDGGYGAKLTGPFSRLAVRPLVARAAGGAKSSRSRSRAAATDAEGSDGEDTEL